MTNTQDPRRHPLQDDEVELARVLRALPAGEPSAKVDAAILAAASDAVAASGSSSAPRRRRVRAAWAIPSWAIGTAAAAVLAVGIGVQLLPPPSVSTADRARMPSAPASAKQESDDRLDVELIERRREIAPTYPPPPPPVQPAPAPPPALSPPPPPVPIVEYAPEPQAFPAPVRADESTELDSVTVTGSRTPERESRLRKSPSELNRLDAERRERVRQAQLSATRAEAANEQRREQQAAALADADSSADAFAEAAPAEAQADVAEAAVAAEAASAFDGHAAPAAARDAAAPVATAPASPAVGASGALTQPAAAAKAVLPPVANDAVLAPADWFVRIRERWHAGDRDGARASVRLLREKHPSVAIPADIAPLLR